MQKSYFHTRQNQKTFVFPNVQELTIVKSIISLFITFTVRKTVFAQ